jgi:hypothetical protein
MANLIQEKDARSNDTLTLDSGIGTNNALIVAVKVLSTTVTVTSVSIGGNAMTPVPDGQNLLMSHAGPGSDGARVSYFKLGNITGNPTGVAVVLSGTPGDTSYIQAWEVDGTGSGTVDAVEDSGAVVTVNTAATVSFDTTGPGFAVAVIGSTTTGAFTPGSGWTTSFSDAGSANFLHREISAAGSYTADATVPGSWNATVLVIRDATAGATGSGTAALPAMQASGSGTVGAGPQSVTLAAPLATAGQRLRTMPDLAPGDIVEYEVFSGTGTITVNTNGSFVASAGVTHFRYRVNDGSGFGDWVVDEVRAQRIRPATIIRLPGFGASGTGTVS